MLKQKTIILTFILSVFLSLNSCKKNETIELIPSLSATTLEQISTIAAVIQSNPDIGESLLNFIPANSEFNGLKNARIISEEMPIELKKALEDFKADPKKVLRSIAKESQGADKISLLEALFTQKDADILEKRAKVFVNITIPENAKKGIRFDANKGSKNGRISCSEDCQLHVMAGAAIAMGVSATIYAFATWWSWEIKAAMIVVVGVTSGIMFGALKEWADSTGRGNVEGRDFRNILLGSLAGGALTFALFSAIHKPILAATVALGGAILFGYEPTKNFIECYVLEKC